jgi:DNA-binding XRE family transcriptional regulator
MYQGTRNTHARITRHRHLEQERLDDFGPPPENPFRALRLLCNLTLDDLAGVAYVSRQALIRLEQGTYWEPLPTVIDYWTKYYQSYPGLRDRTVTMASLQDSYLYYQEQQRKRHHHYFGPELAIDCTTYKHPLRQLKEFEDYTTTQVSKALCLPQATLQHWEKKWATQQTVPSHFQTVLGEVGYSHRAVGEFCANYREWRLLRLVRSRG